jgi:hypothetical protein
MIFGDRRFPTIANHPYRRIYDDSLGYGWLAGNGEVSYESAPIFEVLWGMIPYSDRIWFWSESGDPK